MFTCYTWTVLLALFCAFVCVHLIAAVDAHLGGQQTTPDPTSARKSQAMNSDNGEGHVRKKSRLGDPPSSNQFPQTLEGFGYKFNEKGQLRHIKTGKEYNFEFEKGNQALNQKRYEALGKVITSHVYELLETETNLQRIHIPLDATSTEPRSFIFVSQHALTTKGRVLVLINGSGAVRAGQWARRLIINDCLDSGTQIPYIKRAIQAGYEVVVLNTNENRGTNDRGDSLTVRGSANAYEHSLYVWDNFIANRPVEHVAIVAHSMGGSVTAHIAEKREQSFLKKAFALAFTDSVHSLKYPDVSSRVRRFFAKHSVNWISSGKPLDTPIPTATSDMDSIRVSAGTKTHAETSWTSINSVFSFLKDKEDELNARRGQTQDKSAASLAQVDEFDDEDEDEDEDDEKTLEMKYDEEAEDDSDDVRKEGDGQASSRTLAKVQAAGGIEVSSSEDDSQASFDFMRYSEEL